MEDEWSRWGLDLHVHLRPGTGHGLRTGLEHALRDAVRSGRLRSGTRLPSSRALARDLGIARGTVTQALDQLVAEGYLESKPRSGIRVAPQPAAPPAEIAPPSHATLRPVRGIDLRSGFPDLAAFPRREWLAATRHILQTAPNTAFGYRERAGAVELRQALAEYLGRARGVSTTPDHIVVCAGYAHALRLVCQVLRHHHGGSAGAFAFEDPTEPDHPALVEQLGHRARRIPVDRDGLIVEGLTDESAVVVTPAHQYPLGVTLSPARRVELVSWARRTGAFIVEDDYDGEFRYDRQPVGALQGMAPDRVIYAGTASKTIAPGLRLAWLVLPGGLLGALREATRWDESSVNVIDQLVLARLVQTGELDRHVRRCRARYRRRRDLLGQAVARHLPHGRLSGIAAGLHAVLRLPAGSDHEGPLLGHLAARGIHVEGISPFYQRPEQSPLAIVIGYATPAEHAYGGALSALVDALRERMPAIELQPRSG
ncbi:PLP-dependent aminotransferase family protein [Nonomuraea sp. SMC257]|uniref:PLP-dependent aminotransferase family protein n=1 Tax=Nonomuraea montanisoli TaxID=2741721 RepID=A0A7Y6IE89_9ACTN|nr:PLP-dependent aminotransferase family protein [Nonomuraea montanisoli]NUW36659.1 PLP-dependent aminotransferase family protein [Nonomuraea montanisoli]